MDLRMKRETEEYQVRGSISSMQPQQDFLLATCPFGEVLFAEQSVSGLGWNRRMDEKRNMSLGGGGSS